jgi:hypothetical protein
LFVTADFLICGFIGEPEAGARLTYHSYGKFSERFGFLLQVPEPHGHPLPGIEKG